MLCHRNHFTAQPELLCVKRLRQQSLLSPIDEKPGRRVAYIRFGGDQLRGLRRVERSQTNTACSRFHNPGEINEMPSIRQKMRGGLEFLMPRLVQFDYWLWCSALG